MLLPDPNAENSAVADPELTYNSLYLSDFPRIAETFLLNTKQSIHRIPPRILHPLSLLKSSILDGRRVAAVCDIQALPKPVRIATRVDESIRWRRSRRKFVKRAVDLGKVASILYYADGVTGEAKATKVELCSDDRIRLLAHPSAGAIYSIKVYLIAQNVQGLENMIYLYDHYRHVLKRIGSYDSKELIESLTVVPTITVSDASFVLVLVSDVWKVLRKYGNRGLRYIFIEAGQIAENVHLVSRSLGLGSLDFGNYYDKLLEDLLGLDGLSSQAIHVVLAGATAD